MNAKRAKLMRRAAKAFANAGTPEGCSKLPERQLNGGQHRVEMRVIPSFIGEASERPVLVCSQGENERMSVRGIYRALKREAA